MPNGLSLLKSVCGAALIVCGTSLLPSNAKAQELAVPAAQSGPIRIPLEGCTPVAEPPPSLSIGSCLRATLTQQRPRHDYAFRLESGNAVLVEMDSIPRPAPPENPGDVDNGFDTYLEIFSEGGGERLVSNDDSRNSLNSTLVFVAPVSGNYFVRARPLGSALRSERGEYALRIRSIPPPPAPTPLETRVSGRMGPAELVPYYGDPSINGLRYSFSGTSGERVLLRLQSEVRFTTLELRERGGARIASEFAAEPVLDLFVELPRTGEYVVQVGGGGTNLAGPREFTLEKIQGAGPSARPNPIPLVPEQAASGILSLGSEIQTRGRTVSYLFDTYSLAVQPGVNVILRITSSDFQPVLSVGVESPLGFASVAPNEVGGAISPLRLIRTRSLGNSYVLELRPQQAGNLLVRAHAQGLAIGPYTIIVATIPARPLP